MSKKKNLHLEKKLNPTVEKINAYLGFAYISTNNKDFCDLIISVFFEGKQDFSTWSFVIERIKKKENFIDFVYDIGLSRMNMTWQPSAPATPPDPYILKVLQVLWDEKHRPSKFYEGALSNLIFGYPINNTLEGKFARHWSSGSSLGKNKIKSVNDFFHSRPLPPKISYMLVRHFWGISKVNHKEKVVLDLLSDLHTQVDYNALARSDNLFVAKTMQSIIRNPKTTKQINNFIVENNIDVLTMVKRVLNLGSSETVFGLVDFINFCLDKFGPQCITPSNKVVLFNKHAENLNSYIKEPLRGSENQVKSLLQFLSTVQLKEEIKQNISIPVAIPTTKTKRM